MLPANPSWVWQDSGSGADYDVGLWEVLARDHRSMTAATFKARPSYGDAGSSRYWALNKSATANEELRGVAVDMLTIQAFAPRVRLAPDEYYWPSSTQFFLANVHQENGHLVTNQPLGCDSCTDPPVPGRPAAGSDAGARLRGGCPPHPGRPAHPRDGRDLLELLPVQQRQAGVHRLDVALGLRGGYSTFGNHVGTGST